MIAGCMFSLYLRLKRLEPLVEGEVIFVRSNGSLKVGVIEVERTLSQTRTPLDYI